MFPALSVRRAVVCPSAHRPLTENLQFPSSLSRFGPIAHVMFVSPETAQAVRNQAPLYVGDSELTLVEDHGRWGGAEHEEYLVRAGTVVRQEDGGMAAVIAARASGGGFGVEGKRSTHVRGKQWEGVVPSSTHVHGKQ